MHVRRKLPSLLAALAVPFAAMAAPAACAADDAAKPPAGWSLGIGAVTQDTPYAGEDTRVQPFPVVGYEGERVFLRGLAGGVKLVDADGFELSAQLSARLDQVDPDDLGTDGLAANGVDRARLRERDRGVDAGLAARWRGGWGEARASVRRDIADNSDGHEATVEYGFPIPLAGGRLVPRIGATYASDRFADYYYGVDADELLPGGTAYAPGSFWQPHVALEYMRPLGERWMLASRLSWTDLADEVVDSPLVEDDAGHAAALTTSLTWRF